MLIPVYFAGEIHQYTHYHKQSDAANDEREIFQLNDHKNERVKNRQDKRK